MDQIRRDLLLGSAAVLAASAASTAWADHSHHAGHGSNPMLTDLIRSSGDCVAAGEACLAHCLILLGKGDTAMAECARSVNEMLAVCTALQKLAAQESARTSALARIAADTCEACEKACRKHEKTHAECKQCADACSTCLKACKKAIS